MEYPAKKLTKNKEFEKVFQGGRASYSNFLGIKAVANGLQETRFGILISAKISKKAVERNKLRRWIKEIIRHNKQRITTGFDCVVITLPAIKAASYEEVEKSVLDALRRLKILNNA